MKYGFVGLGQMGLPMALNLGKKHEVTAFADRIVAPVPEGSIAVVADLAGVAGCQRLILSLPTAAVVEDVLFGSGGLAAMLSPGTVIVDTGTSEYSETLGMAERLGEMGLGFVDAPVSGMPSRAQDGTLTMMVGGEAALVEELRDALGTMASKVLHMGPVGSGQLTKVINNLLYDINIAALAEILPLATKLGLEPEMIAQVVNSGTGRSHASEFFIPRILKGDFSEGYPLGAAYKDLVSGATISAREAVPLPVLAAATATYQQAIRAGHGEKDKGSMILPFEAMLGVAFRAKGD